MDDPKKYEVSMNLIYFAGNFAEDIRDYTEDVIWINLINISFLHQTMIIVNICADTLFHSLKLR